MTQPKKLSPLGAFKRYVAIKTHFRNPDFDYFAYNKHIKVGKVSFEKRNDRAFFAALAKKYNEQELENLFVANLVYNDDTWVGDLLDSKAVDIYRKWQQRTESLTYQFEQNILNLLDFAAKEQLTFVDLCMIRGDEHPLVFSALMQGLISIETFIILTDLLKLFTRWDGHIVDDVIYPMVRFKCEKYRAFLNYDRKKFRALLNEILTTNCETAKQV